MKFEDLFKCLSYTDVVLDSRYSFAFFTHNKNAQTSINRYLLSSRSIVKKDDVLLWGSVKERYIAKYNSNQLKNVTTFTIIRNPIYRYISGFLYLQKINKIAKQIDINEWTINVFSNTGPKFDPHFKEQEKYHKPIMQLEFDFILNFNTLHRDWANLARHICAPTELPHKNSTKKNSLFLSTYSKKILEDIYYDDFKLFENIS